MLELLLTTAVFAAAILSLRGRPTASGPGMLGTDLPCPWCEAATTESDVECPSCGRAFGSGRTDSGADALFSDSR